jgi:uncharacterized protein YbcI
MLAALSNVIVRAYRDALGRGPTRARTHHANHDLLVCVLQDTLTPAERQLVSAGRHEEVRHTRALLIKTIEPQLRDAVQELTGRRVIGVVSGFNPWEDIASEAFLLEHPEGDHQYARSDQIAR